MKKKEKSFFSETKVKTLGVYSRAGRCLNHEGHEANPFTITDYNQKTQSKATSVLCTRHNFLFLD
jgi:hypothetical protein